MADTEDPQKWLGKAESSCGPSKCACPAEHAQLHAMDWLVAAASRSSVDLSCQEPSSCPDPFEDATPIMLQTMYSDVSRSSNWRCLNHADLLPGSWRCLLLPLQLCQAHHEDHLGTCPQIHLLPDSNTVLDHDACPDASGPHICHLTDMSWLPAHASCPDAIGLQPTMLKDTQLHEQCALISALVYSILVYSINHTDHLSIPLLKDSRKCQSLRARL